MYYPKPIIKQAYLAILAEKDTETRREDIQAMWEDIEMECAIYESETGAYGEVGFESYWYEDVLDQVEKTYNIKV